MILLSFYLWKNNDSIAQIIANDSTLGIFLYILSNPAYLLLFFTILVVNQEAGFFKNLIASTMIIYSSDIISFPRLPPSGLPTTIDILASSDGLVIHKLLHIGLTYQVAWTFYYLILPIGLTLGALAILGYTNFFKALVGRGA